MSESVSHSSAGRGLRGEAGGVERAAGTPLLFMTSPLRCPALYCLSGGMSVAVVGSWYDGGEGCAKWQRVMVRDERANERETGRDFERTAAADERFAARPMHPTSRYSVSSSLLLPSLLVVGCTAPLRSQDLREARRLIRNRQIGTSMAEGEGWKQGGARK